MSQSLWFVLTWVAGTAAILGSFMTLGSLILWITPAQSRSRKLETRKPETKTQSPLTVPLWQYRLKLLAFSVAIALAGLGILLVMPFPSV